MQEFDLVEDIELQLDVEIVKTAQSFIRKYDGHDEVKHNNFI